MTAPPAIELREVVKRYGDVQVVRGVSVSIAQGETFVLIGPSGCGKSTTLKMMNRLVEPTEGTVLVAGQDVRDADAALLRLGIGYVIQDVGLFPHWTVARNIRLVPELLEWDQRKIDARVDELLTLVGLPTAEYGDRYPRQLSGGQRQRAGIARALAADPPVVLLDEPFSALDPITRERMQDEFLALSERLGKTFVLVTHDIVEAVRLADRIGVMRDGCLVQVGTPREIVHTPADDQVAALLGRHRYQLRLMTMTVSEVCGEGDGRAEALRAADGARTLTVHPETSAWDVLDQMEQERAELLRLEVPKSGVRYVTRRDLLGALGS